MTDHSPDLSAEALAKAEPVFDSRVDALQFRVTTLERDATDMFLWLSLIIGLTLGIAVAAAVRRG